MFTIDPRVLARASRDLIRHGRHIDDECPIPTPQTGRIDCQAQQAVAHPVDRPLADAPRDLGDGLAQVAGSLTQPPRGRSVEVGQRLLEASLVAPDLAAELVPEPSSVLITELIDWAVPDGAR
ncbi:MAG: hypothetical protein WKF79_04605 [Nocardioides sp.]